VPLHVAEDERGALEPRDAAQRREVGDHPEIAVAALPARECITGYRVHLHLEREQVVAALHRMPGPHLVDEELAVEALAHQPPLHVGERHDDGVDRARLDVGPQLVEREHGGDPTRAVRHVDNDPPSGA
jgi:hypothetical protein